MDPSAVGVRLASSVVAPLVKKLFVPEGPGAGLVAGPVRISRLVSFRGERRTLTEADLHRLAAELVTRALRAGGPSERPVSDDEREALAHALATTLHGLGDLHMDDVQAVHLGPTALAERLLTVGPHATHGLSRDAELLHGTLLDTACLHIVHFFTQRSTFVARTLVQQSRSLDGLIRAIDTFIAQHPSPAAADTAFERGYLTYLARKHGRLTIYGIDLAHSPDRWPLDAAYMSLEATQPAAPALDGAGLWEGTDGPPAGPAAPVAVPADQALAGRDRVLLRGVAGSGKSTLVQWLAVCCTKPAGGTPLPHLYGRIPFVLPLRTLTRDGAPLPTPDRFLAAVGCPVSGSQPDGWADRVLASGRALLLVDGLDEIPDREREQTRHWLRDLLDAFPDSRWLVTTRPSAVREDWLASDGFGELTLSPMRRAEVTAFIDRWHDAARCDAEDPERLDGYRQSLLAAVHTKQDLARLATNPLMCGLICALHRDRRGYLPTGRKQLYDAALSMLLSRRDRERDMAAPTGIDLTEEPQIQLLQRLAYWLIRNGRTELDRERAERLVADALPAVPSAAAQGDGPAVLRHLLLRSGLLCEPVPGAVQFVHRTFQDYLGAKAAVEDGDTGLLVSHAADSQWEDVIRLAVAHARPRERAEILRELLAHGDALADDLTRIRVHLLGLACLEHATELDPRVRAEVHDRAGAILPPRDRDEANLLAEVGPIVLELLPGPDGLADDEVAEVVATAAQLGSDAGLEVLKRFRHHPFPQNQLAAHWPKFDTERYVEEVLRHLSDEATFVVSGPEDMRVLQRLGGRTRINALGPLTARELLDGLPTERITHLTLSDNDELAGLDFLTEFPALRSLTLMGCPGVGSLAPLAGLPLSTLTVTAREHGGVRCPDGLALLRHLRHLMLHVPLPPEGLQALPAAAPLETLLVGHPVAAGFGALRHWPRLRILQLRSLDAACAEGAWGALTDVPGLEEFAFGLAPGETALRIPPGLRLPQVTTLSAINMTRGPLADLSRSVRAALPAFPALRKLQLYGIVGGSVALPPLTDLPELREVLLSYLHPEPALDLPPQVTVTHFPRPRT
ncbi:NACHT domain-containing protein [Streptomyces sp. NPDC056411]|uniref:NACHT domain-containing protein n=1 Tax=Streptomyces sp. NPDC056411 TaxID=3345813 RepID=UPI0035DACFEA